MIISNRNSPIMNKEQMRQYKEEIDSWKRVLAFLQSENNYLKFRLAHLVSLEASQRFLDRAETLQNELIQKDELIALNRSGLSDFDKWVNQNAEMENGNGEILKRRENIRQQITQLEQKCSRHTADFNDHLTEYF